jgi:hypothetical protein
MLPDDRSSIVIPKATNVLLMNFFITQILLENKRKVNVCVTNVTVDKPQHAQWSMLFGFIELSLEDSLFTG